MKNKKISNFFKSVFETNAKHCLSLPLGFLSLFGIDDVTIIV
jgi:hypothetical protein